MATVSAEQKQAMVDVDLWQEFCARRDELKLEGLAPRLANKQALDEYLPRTRFGDEGNGTQDGKETGLPPISGKKDTLPDLPEEVASRSVSEVEVIRWVANHIDHPAINPEDCPSPAAWTMLRLCKAQPAFLANFMQNIWTKLLPAKAQMDGLDGDGEIDGRPTIQLIGRIRVMSRRAKGEAE